MFGGSKAVIGLDVGSYSVKAVALQSNRDRVTLQGYAQARVENQDVGEVIRKVLAQLGVKSRRVVSAVSGRSVIVRQVDTPKLQGDALKQHITYEADKYIPFGTDEVIIDCQPMPPRPGGDANTQPVMLVAVRKGLISEHLATLRSAGMTPEVIDVDVFAVANAFELFGPALPPEVERKAAAVIDIGASKSNIAILQAERVLFTREVYLAGNEISDAIARTLNYEAEDADAVKLAPGDALDAIIDAAMPAFEDLANEIRLSFDYVEGQFDTEVSSVILTGGSAQLPSVAAILGNILTRPVHVFDPLAGIDLVPSKYDIHGLDANSPGLTVALGLAAHALGHDSKSLGGPQSLNWQPRSRGGEIIAGSQANEGQVEESYADETVQETAETVPTQAPATASFQSKPATSSFRGSTSFAPPSVTPTPAYVLPPPPGSIPAAAPIDQLDDLDDDGSPATASGKFKHTSSSLLVVLDEDEDGVPSERHGRHSASITRNKPATGTFTPGVFKEDSDPDGLPELPELPKRP